MEVLRMAGELEDDGFLFAMLTAIVKKFGGEIRLCETDVTTSSEDNELLGLLYDVKTDEIVFKLVNKDLKHKKHIRKIKSVKRKKQIKNPKDKEYIN
jgi:hypothetical protein